ncbi:MAG: SAM-dependent DNA methyltransferase, partial [Lentisphaeria bacterium]|nr:SAM-dependent DNA methyltransferase [Lentisphaeria bacterium]
EDFDWSGISPTIFGAVFESTLNPETRRAGGMHYTSIENIHKDIDPLFLDDLKSELDSIIALKDAHDRDKRLLAFQDKLASLTFLDPACGSGNFLTETYLWLRKLENRILEARNKTGHIDFTYNPIKVSIGQFYGIEINDFAVSVAKTALWISESQMMRETEDIVHMDLDFLPLKSYANIVEGNALRIDWNDVISKNKLNYIMGNPPFCGYTYQTTDQKFDLQNLFSGIGKKIDYVSGWYFKAAVFMQDTGIHTAFVSTNSITQGEQVASVWKPLIEQLGIHIDFAHRTFIWDSEANFKAHVHCVIIGFSHCNRSAECRLYDGQTYLTCPTINPYLTNAPNVFIESRIRPLCAVPEMCKGSQPTDGGNFIIESETERSRFIESEPISEKYIRQFMGAEEFINGKKRFCLWLVDASPVELKKCPQILKRIDAVRETRLKSPKEATRKFALFPTLFTENRQPNSDYLLIPSVASEKRLYLPIGFISRNVVASNLVLIIPSATLFHFGVLESSVHMAWMRTVCGRLKSDYRYSKDIVYNNFPWPDCTTKQSAKAAELRQEISETAQGILNARSLYPDCSLA